MSLAEVGGILRNEPILRGNPSPKSQFYDRLRRVHFDTTPSSDSRPACKVLPKLASSLSSGNGRLL
jgi:hypothetical protein